MAESGKTNGGNGGTPDPYAALAFPCRFEIKVMGEPSNRFRALVSRIFTEHLDNSEDLLQVLERHSRHGRYVSMTYIIWARRDTQIRAIYQGLSRCESVLMTL